MRSTIVRPSQIEGRGLFALRDFSAGEVVESITYEILWGESESKYVMVLSKGRLAVLKNKTKYVNASGDPNVSFDLDRGLVASRAIATGDELTSDYTHVFS